MPNFILALRPAVSDLETPFLQEIARQPHDWLSRLIFGDWLEERGTRAGTSSSFPTT